MVIATPKRMATCTTTGAIALGSTWRSTMRRVVHPNARDAST